MISNGQRLLRPARGLPPTKIINCQAGAGAFSLGDGNANYAIVLFPSQEGMDLEAITVDVFPTVVVNMYFLDGNGSVAPTAIPLGANSFYSFTGNDGMKGVLFTAAAAGKSGIVVMYPYVSDAQVDIPIPLAGAEMLLGNTER